MRRLVAAALAAGVALVPAGAAHAQEETPQGRFSSPSRAVAGAPIWVRSITPCPMTAGSYEYVRVFIHPQDTPHLNEEIDATSADLAADGSWTVTIAAPADMPEGVTKSYSVHAQCREDPLQYWDPLGVEQPAPPVIVSNFRYFLRPLYVTGFGTAAADEDEDEESTDEETTTTTSTTSTTLATATTATTAAELVAAAATGPTTTWTSDEAQRAAEARAELAKRGTSRGDVRLAAAPVASTTARPEPDAGVPWWSFVLATMLAVGAVIGYGQRRRSSAAG